LKILRNENKTEMSEKHKKNRKLLTVTKANVNWQNDIYLLTLCKEPSHITKHQHKGNR